MDDLSASVAEDCQDEENPESGGRDCKEINGDHAGHVIFQEAPPRNVDRIFARDTPHIIILDMLFFSASFKTLSIPFTVLTKNYLQTLD